MKAIVLFLGLALLSCNATFKDRDWANLPIMERQNALEEITRKCGLPANRATILEGNQVVLKPAPNDAYEAVDCLLRGLTSLRGIQLGFVGNEAYTNEVQ